MGELTAGNPVYYNMHAEEFDDAHSPRVNRKDPTLGVVIGVLLSVCCVIVCLSIIVWHRRKLERNEPNASASPNATSSSVAKIAVGYDQHEMETLISKQHLALERVSVALPVGAGAHIGRCNGSKQPGSEEESSVHKAIDVESDLGEGSSDGRYGFIFSSTPKREHSDEVPETNDDASLLTVENTSLDVKHSVEPQASALNTNNNITLSTPIKIPQRLDLEVII